MPFDLHLLARGQGLHVLLQQLWQRFGQAGRGYSQADVVQLAGELDPQLPALLQGLASGVDDLPLSGYLKTVGFDLSADPAEFPYSGLQAAFKEGQSTISKVWIAVALQSWQQVSLQETELLALDAERLRSAEQLGPLLIAGGQHGSAFAVMGLFTHGLESFLAFSHARLVPA